VREILDAYEMGFSITEKVFKVDEQGKLALKDLLTRHPNSWLIYQDAHGNITKFEQKSTEKGDIAINPKSIIHYTNNPKYQNPYGKSDLRPAYNAWFVKRQVVRYLGIFLEGSAKPIPVGRYDVNSPEGTADTLLEILKTFQIKTALALPKEIQVDFLESKSNGEAFHKAINIFNMFIGRAMFIPDLLGMSGSETSGGSLALGKEQMNIFFMHINRRRATIEKIIQKHILRTLCLYNYGDVDVPEFKLNPLDDQAAIELAKVWLDFTKTKVAKPTEEEINHFRKLVKFPEGEVELVEQPQQQLDENGMPIKPNNSPNKGDKDPKEEQKEVEKEDEKTFAKVYNLPKGNYHKKVDFKAASNKLNDYDASIKAETAPIVKRIFSDLYEQLKRKKVLESKDISKLDNLSLKYKSELKKALKQSFMQIYKDGQVMAAHELNKGDFALPTTSEEFLNLLEQETFNYIGKYEYGILEKVRQQIVVAIKDGLPLSSVIDILDNEGKKLSEVSLERYARTKHTEVMNRGRHEYFQNSGVVAAYQYSAILDDRTSEICAGLDGKIFAAGTEPIPPLHFNCRSLLIPITKYEEWEADTKVGKTDIDKFIDDNKGDSFSTYTKKENENLDFKTEHPDEKTEVITYFSMGKPTEKITLTYSDYTKTKIESKVTEKINEKV
jgi:SPP1 gp7 family putative phage head morphogenesis protein